MTKKLAIVGPTGVGKSLLACQVAIKLGGEIINTDSRQVYRGMDIGTAKPTKDQMSSVNHHLYDVVDPSDTFDIHLFKRMAISMKTKIEQQKRVPIFVGGTGQYVWSVVEDWEIQENQADTGLREELELKLQSEGLGSLVADLQRRYPEAVSAIDILNPRRVVRALEKAILGYPIVNPRPKIPSSTNGWTIVGLTLERARLYKSVDRRIDDMVEVGWVAEVRHLVSRGLSPELSSMGTIGYQEIYDFLGKRRDWSETIASIRARTHRLIRTQYNWFKLSDPRIDWYDVGDTDMSQISEQISSKILDIV